MSRTEEISRHIAEEIARREPGERLPTVREMMKRFRTAQRTVEAALAPFIAEGRLQVRRGAGIVVTEPATRAQAWEADVLILYRISASRLARNLLMELESRLRARDLRVMLLGFSDDAHALSVLSRLGRFRVCLVQVHFEPLQLPFLASLAEHADSVVVDGISTTGVGIDAIGTNWREALVVAMRRLREKGHARIAFLTSGHPARQIAMARREYRRLGEAMPGGGWLIELDALPGDYTSDRIVRALESQRDPDGRLPFTALVLWGLVDGLVLDSALSRLGLLGGRDLSVILLGSVDFGPEHLNSFDVVGNRDAEKIDRFEAVILSRLEDDTTEPDTHYLPLHRLDFGSVADLTE